MIIGIPGLNPGTKFPPILSGPWVRHVGITVLVLTGQAIDDVVGTIASEQISSDQLCILGSDVSRPSLGFAKPGGMGGNHEARLPQYVHPRVEALEEFRVQALE